MTGDGDMRKKKIKAKVDEKGFLTFLEDDDGVSERDYLLLITTTVFFGGIAFGLVFTIIGMFFGFELPAVYIELIKTMDIVVTTIVGGIFAVKATQTYMDKKKSNTDSEENNGEDDVV